MRHLAGLPGGVALVAIAVSAGAVTVTFAGALNPCFDTRGGPFRGSDTALADTTKATPTGFDARSAILRRRPILPLAAR